MIISFSVSERYNCFICAKKLKEAKDASTLGAIFKHIVQPDDPDDYPKKDTTTNDGMPKHYQLI